MSASTSIKRALKRAGASYTIFRTAGDVSGEYLDSESNSQVTKPFIREFFLEAMLSHDTEVITGDVIELDTPGDRYLVMNKTPQVLKNAIILNDAVLYKANVSGELYRASGEGVWNNRYRQETSWEQISGEGGSVCYALQTEPLHGIELQTDEELGQIGIENHELYIPISFGVQINDRYQPASGEYFRVNSVKERRYPGVDVVLLEEDQRR